MPIKLGMGQWMHFPKCLQALTAYAAEQESLGYNLATQGTTLTLPGHYDAVMASAC